LAFNDKGRELLKLMKEKATVPIVTKINQFTPQSEDAKKMLEMKLNLKELLGRAFLLMFLYKPYVMTTVKVYVYTVGKILMNKIASVILKRSLRKKC